MTLTLKHIRGLAAIAHRDQKYGDRPYMDHVDEVVAVVREAGFGRPFQIVALLHDTIEDTSYTPELLREFGFSEQVIFGVMLVTDEPGPNRKTRKAATYAKVQQAKTDTEHVQGIGYGLIAKWGDRIANMRASVQSGSKGLLKMYQKESPKFRQVYMPEGLTAHLAQGPGFQSLLVEYDLVGV